MPSLPQSTPPPVPPAIDLSQVTEATRRQLYDIVVQVHFNPTPEEVAEARRKGEWYQRYGPDEARVTVGYLAGRWFVYWRIWDAEDNCPEDQEWEVLRVEPSLSHPYGVEFFEV